MSRKIGIALGCVIWLFVLYAIAQKGIELEANHHLNQFNKRVSEEKYQQILVENSKLSREVMKLKKELEELKEH